METIAPYGFLIGGLIMLLFIGYVATLAGPSIIENAPSAPVFNSDFDKSNPITYIYNMFLFTFDNVAYFFRLMTVSSSFALIGVFIIIPFLFILGLTLLQIIVELNPG